MVGLGSGTNYIPAGSGVVSSNNSSIVPLGIGAEFTGIGEDVSIYSSVTVNIKTDEPGIAYLEWSSDNTNWDFSEHHHVDPTNPLSLYMVANVKARYFRIRLLNDGTAQTFLRLQSIFNLGKAESTPPAQDFDDGNSTTTAAASFVGDWELRSAFNGVLVTMASDVAGTLFFEFYDQDAPGTTPDSGTTPTSIYPPTGFDYTGTGFNEFHQAVKGPRWFRVRWVGDTTPTTLRISSYYIYDVSQPQIPLKQRIAQDADAVIVRAPNILEVMKKRYENEFIENKFGRNPDIDTATVPECIWNGGGLYTGFPTTTAEEFQVFSSDANDTLAGTGARTLRVFYLDDDYDGVTDVDYPYFDVDLNGVTTVNSGVTGMRVLRAEVIDSGSGETNAGDITVRWRTTTTTVFAVIPTGYSQTQIAAYTIPADYTGYITRYNASMGDNNTNSAIIAFRIREFNTNTWRIQRQFVISTDNHTSRMLYGGVGFGERTDIQMIVTDVTNNNAIITGSFDIHLVKNT